MKPTSMSMTIWSSVVRDRRGRIKHRCPEHPNLRVSAGTDWQAEAMVGLTGTSNINVAQRAATSTTATSLTDTGAAFPTTVIINGATGELAGRIVAVGPNTAGAGSTVYGVIVTNSATVLTVDRWVAAGSNFAAGTTPNGTAQYQVLPVMAPSWYMALSSTSITPANADVVLSGELTTGGFARTNPTSWTHTSGTNTVSIVNTFTASATQTINSEAIFTASGNLGVGTAATAGIMTFESSEPNPPTLVSGDTLQQTVQITY
jgi:hypothetical protein